MRLDKISLLFFLMILLLSGNPIAQVITADPEFPTPNDSVTITFDATEGDQELMDYSGDVYAHTGITANGDRWQYVIAEWSENIDKAKLTRVSENTYELNIKPSIREYYDANAEDVITELCFVFRSSDGERQTEDLFYDVLDFHVAIDTPATRRFVAKKDEKFYFKASANESDSIELYIDNELQTTVTSSSLSDSLSFNSTGQRWIWAKAYSGTETNTDSLRTFIRGDVNVAELPQGVSKGINYINDTTVTLVLHAPGKEFAFALGDFSNWGMSGEYYMNRTPDSTHFWVTLDNIQTGQEYRYQYFVDGEITIADPYTEKILDPWNDQYISSETYPKLIDYPGNKTEGIVSVFQTAQEEYQWQVNDFQPPDKEDLVIYELLIRDFTKNDGVGDLHGVMDRLGYLDSLGVNAIELMPVNEFEGNNSWGYNPSFYFAFDKAYGQKKDLKAFVDSCHKRGIAVLVDMVLNHSYGQSPFVQLYFDPDAGEYGQPTAANPWYNETCPHPPYCWGFDFDHQSEATKNLVDSINTFWLKEYNVDGFRFDFTKGFTNNTSNDEGWSYDQQRIDNLKRMADDIWKTNSDAYVILEHFTENSEEKELANYGMMLWGNMNSEYNEATMGYHDNNKSDFSGVSYKEHGWDKPHLVGYMESHDEERLMYKNLQYGNASGSYDITELGAALDRIELAATFFLTVPGPKMIWQFGELGYDISIDSNDRVGKKPVKWEYNREEDRKDLYNVFAALNYLCNKHEVFNTSDYSLSVAGETKQITLVHNSTDVVIMGNFGVTENTLYPNFTKTGEWYEAFTGDTLNLESLDKELTLSPGEYRLYSTIKFDLSEFIEFEDQEDDTTTAIQSFASEGEVKVFPNPARDVVTFEFESSGHSQILLNIYNRRGQKVASERKAALNPGKSRIQWSKSAGDATEPNMYFYELLVGGERYTGKFFKY